jgi:hypothetical protein
MQLIENALEDRSSMWWELYGREEDANIAKTLTCIRGVRDG